MFDINNKLNNKLKEIPESPGVYIMRDKNKNIIYIGKAINLKRRVRQYFLKSVSHNKKTKAMVKNIAFFEYILTNNELEALILEANLIKENRPKYNILLKDDKTYPYIKINLDDKFPNLEVTHKHEINKNKNIRYFGPYISNLALKKNLDLIYSIWPIRSCKNKLKKNKRPCLNYYIKKCSAPCCDFINHQDYNNFIKQIINFLEGDNKNIINKLNQKMLEYAQNLEFEKAINLRDKIFFIKNLGIEQNMDLNNNLNYDILGVSRDNNLAVIKIFFMRAGKIINQAHFFLKNIDYNTRDNILIEFIKQFYGGQNFIPKEIIIGENIINKSLLEKYLSYIAKRSIKIICPVRGQKNKLLNLASRNANLILEQTKNNYIYNNSFDEHIIKLKNILGLDILNSIEAFDISNLNNKYCVGAMIRLNNNGFDKKNYRRYKLKDNFFNQDDYKSTQEIISRRLKYNNKPDLFLIDGGRGHVNSVKQILNNLNLNIPVCGMIKNKSHKTKSIFFNNQEIYLPKNILAFITLIQDEVHRFAINYHRKLRDII